MGRSCMAARLATGCLIGMGAIVINGAKVGDGSIIGAGAVITEGKDIPPNSVVVGVPGKIVKQTDAGPAAAYPQ